MAPERRYSRDHTWVERREDGLLVGLTAYALDRLGSLRHLLLTAAVGQQLAPGESFGSVESDKAVVDLYTPVGGQVLAVHDALAHAPARLHDDCYHDGWMLRLGSSDPADSGEFVGLLDATAYSELLKTRAADL
jgi:glycine cleavage system H protein